MSHLFSSFHVLEHKSKQYDTSSNELKFHEGVDLANSCFYCDTYLNLDYTQHEPLAYSIIAPDCISQDILNREKQLRSGSTHRKKSRSPPFYNS